VQCVCERVHMCTYVCVCLCVCVRAHMCSNERTIYGSGVVVGFYQPFGRLGRSKDWSKRCLRVESPMAGDELTVRLDWVDLRTGLNVV